MNDFAVTSEAFGVAIFLVVIAGFIRWSIETAAMTIKDKIVDYCENH